MRPLSTDLTKTEDGTFGCAAVIFDILQCKRTIRNSANAGSPKTAGTLGATRHVRESGARKQVGECQPKLAVETGLMALDGKIEMFSRRS